MLYPKIKSGYRLAQSFVLIVLVLLLTTTKGLAHQTPTTIVLLDVNPGIVSMELQLPLSELELAFGNQLTKNPETLLTRMTPQLSEYLRAHIHAYVNRERPWTVKINTLRLDKGFQVASEQPYWELVAEVSLEPQSGDDTRQFALDYDVIMHQVINHAALVSVRSDWAKGTPITQPVEAGVIHWNLRDNVIYPLEINLEPGSWWQGFKGMMDLGMNHITEGTDHLLFILTLLLPSMLLVKNKKWRGFAGMKTSLAHLFKIVTSFTIGHSATLLLGAMGWVKVPSQPVEVLIALSILISAIHAIRPIFPGRESYVAIAFGLIHGLAFASVLSKLNLDGAAMALSIFGFNLGIEIMQLLIILTVIPWLFILSRTSFYRPIRLGGAILGGIASISWITERISGSANLISVSVQQIAQYGVWLVGLLAVTALSMMFYEWRRREKGKRYFFYGGDLETIKGGLSKQ